MTQIKDQVIVRLGENRVMLGQKRLEIGLLIKLLHVEDDEVLGRPRREP